MDLDYLSHMKNGQDSSHARLVQDPARIFISYSCKDGVAAAAELRKMLLDEHFSIWQDIIALEGGRDWWSQIETALRSRTLQHFVLVVTKMALASPVVRREIRLARQEGKTVSPVRGPGLGRFDDLPRWLGQVYDLNQPEHRATLISVLRDQSRQPRVPMMAPEPPPDFVKRPAEFDAHQRARPAAVPVAAEAWRNVAIPGLGPCRTTVAWPRQRLLKLSLDQFLDEAPYAGSDAHLDRVEPIRKKLFACTSCRMQEVRLRVMASHGVVSTGALTPESFGLTPGDYATFNFHQLLYGTQTFAKALDLYRNCSPLRP